ncbi:MAG: hypothetical protein HY531_01125 [Chloroflexi bacterium]|nr:hypothetical protein [Chloroflexota bacterium]
MGVLEGTKTRRGFLLKRWERVYYLAGGEILFAKDVAKQAGSLLCVLGAEGRLAIQ